MAYIESCTIPEMELKYRGYYLEILSKLIDDINVYLLNKYGIKIQKYVSGPTLLNNMYERVPEVQQVLNGERQELIINSVLPLTSFIDEIEITHDIERVLHEIYEFDHDKILEHIAKYDTSSIVNEYESYVKKIKEFGKLVGLSDEVIENTIISYELMSLITSFLSLYDMTVPKLIGQNLAEMLGIIGEIPANIKIINKHGNKEICLTVDPDYISYYI